MPSPMQTLRHPDDEDITVVAAAIPKRPTKAPEVSIDDALNELEQEN
jgi:hypothetical protein